MSIRRLCTSVISSTSHRTTAGKRSSISSSVKDEAFTDNIRSQSVWTIFSEKNETGIDKNLIYYCRTRILFDKFTKLSLDNTLRRRYITWRDKPRIYIKWEGRRPYQGRTTEKGSPSFLPYTAGLSYYQKLKINKF